MLDFRSDPESDLEPGIRITGNGSGSTPKRSGSETLYYAIILFIMTQRQVGGSDRRAGQQRGQGEGEEAAGPTLKKLSRYSD